MIFRNRTKFDLNFGLPKDMAVRTVCTRSSVNTGLTAMAYGRFDGADGLMSGEPEVASHQIQLFGR